MKQFFGTSKAGNLAEAVNGLSNPASLFLMSNEKQFERHAAELESLFPGVPSIGCVGMGYDTSVVEDGVCVIAYVGNVSAAANVLEEVSDTFPT